MSGRRKILERVPPTPDEHLDAIDAWCDGYDVDRDEGREEFDDEETCDALVFDLGRLVRDVRVLRADRDAYREALDAVIAAFNARLCGALTKAQDERLNRALNVVNALGWVPEHERKAAS